MKERRIVVSRVCSQMLPLKSEYLLYRRRIRLSPASSIGRAWDSYWYLKVVGSTPTSGYFFVHVCSGWVFDSIEPVNNANTEEGAPGRRKRLGKERDWFLAADGEKHAKDRYPLPNNSSVKMLEGLWLSHVQSCESEEGSLLQHTLARNPAERFSESFNTVTYHFELKKGWIPE